MSDFEQPRQLCASERAHTECRFRGPVIWKPFSPKMPCAARGLLGVLAS